uniref:F-box domain-containing protein n=1 Tax=Mycena chlorophos TaxID=658473 RepID=A0ABQ0LG14_MYCCL|nr:predicted protein [Mycena chlorophos]
MPSKHSFTVGPKFETWHLPPLPNPSLYETASTRWSSLRCTKDCSLHCTASTSYSVPEIPHPDLLIHNDAVPTDEQVRDIRNAIADANSTLSSIDDEIASLSDKIARLKAQRTQIESFVASQSAVVAGVRRLSNELLLEIFIHCANPRYPPFHKYNSLSKILRVSARWRAVAIAYPCLWQNVTITGGLGLRADTLLRQVALQMERTSQSSLSVVLRASDAVTVELLDLVVAASSRWQRADIHISPAHLKHVFGDSIPCFSSLTRLVLVVTEFSPGLATMRPERCLEAFPVLTELTLRVGFQFVPSAFDGIWERLRHCQLEEFHSRDVLKILPRLQHRCSLVLKSCGEPAYDASNHTSAGTSALCRVTSLSIVMPHLRDAFFADMFDSMLFAPNLQKLCVPATDKLVPAITQLLSRSSCILTHLRLQTPDQHVPAISTLTALLQSSQLDNLVHLDITLHPERLAIHSPLPVLAEPGVLPHLETLTIRATDVDTAWIRRLYDARRGVLRWLGVPHGTTLPKEPGKMKDLVVEIHAPLGMEENLIPVSKAPPYRPTPDR